MPKMGKNIYWNSLPCYAMPTLTSLRLFVVAAFAVCIFAQICLNMCKHLTVIFGSSANGSLLAQISEILYYKGFPKDFLGVKLKKATI